MFSALFSALADTCRSLSDYVGAATNDALAQHYSTLEQLEQQNDPFSSSADFNTPDTNSFDSFSSFSSFD